MAASQIGDATDHPTVPAEPLVPATGPTDLPSLGTLPDSLTQTNQVVIRWKQPVGANAARARAQVAIVDTALGGPTEFVRITGSGGAVYRLEKSLGSAANATLTNLRKIPGVASVEPDLWMTASDIPNDTYASNLWGLLGSSDGSPYGADVQTAWATTQGVGVTVAIIDTGLVSHPDLVGQSVAGYDMVSDAVTANDGDGRDGDPSDPGDWCSTGFGRPSSWHGTHVAGTIAALANNGVGVFGGAPAVKIQPVRVLGQCGGYASDVADGIRWASGGTVPGVPANPTPAKVLNLSLGGSSPTCSDDYASAIADARSRGAVVVVAAGNSAADASTSTPANCPQAISVAAIGPTGLKADFSNYGSLVDISGPGVGVWSTVDSGSQGPAAPSYAAYGGTSMAAPHVVVSAALLASADPSLAPDAIEAILKASAAPLAADPSTAGCPALGCGAGVVNAGRAMTALVSPVPIVGMVTASPAYPLPGASITLTAFAVDTSGVVSAQWSVDGGGWSAMSAADGAFNSSNEVVTATLAAPSAEGPHAICIRATDTATNTSAGTSCATVIVDAGAPTASPPLVVPGSPDQGTAVTITATATDGTSVASADIRIDDDPWAIMPAADGAFGGATEIMVARRGGSLTSLEIAYGHSCATDNDGAVSCWGYNAHGELGDGTTVTRPTAVSVPGLTGVKMVAGGEAHECVLLGDSTVSCWGDNSFGQLGDGTTQSRTTPGPVYGLTDVVYIGGGYDNTCALRTDKTVWCWGRDRFGGLGNGNTTNSPVPVPVQGLSGVSSLEVGGYHTCVVLVDTTVRCWGYNAEHQLGNGSTSMSSTPVPVTALSNVDVLSADFTHTCALLLDATVSCWGYNFTGQLGDGTGEPRSTPVAVVDLAGVIDIAIGDQYSCALLLDATVRCWGFNGNGELGNGTTSNSEFSPVSPDELTSVQSIYAGSHSTCAVVTGGTLWCWGYNYSGQLGDGTTDGRVAPVRTLGIGILAGGVHSVCIRVTDRAGNVSTSAGCATITVHDATRPEVLSFAPSTHSPTNATTLTYRLEFTEAITGLGTSDFVIGGTSTGLSVASVTGSGPGPYAVTLRELPRRPAR